MDKKKLSLKKNGKVSIRKDLFGVLDSANDADNSSKDHVGSPLKSIWGESNTCHPQPPSNSLLLSPALKNSPNRFSISPNKQKSEGTPKKKVSSPHKLSKYSPFRKKKVYNVDPNNSIKKFFPVKENSLSQNENSSIKHISLQIQPLNISSPSPNKSHNASSQNSSQIREGNGETIIQEDLSKPSTSMGSITPNKSAQSSDNKLQSANTPSSTPKEKRSGPTSTPQSAKHSSHSPRAPRDIYASFLIRIIVDIVLSDSEEDEASILNEEESAHINAFNKFDLPSQQLYGRLLNRKIDWIRVATMKYGDVILQLMLLELHGFITSDCSAESLEALLNLLTLPELKKICKTYKLPEKGNKSGIISKLMGRARQRSIESFFKPTQESSDSVGETNLRNKIFEQLGSVVKVEKGPLQTFSRCLLFFSYPHFKGLERDRFKDQLALLSEVRNLRFPSYEIHRSKIFQSREQFLMYESALLESSELLEAKEDKDWEKAVQKLKDVANKLKCYLENDEKRCEAERLPRYLRKFTAGGCYARAVSSSVETLRGKEPTLVEECLELLLRQRLFCCHQRGRWYEQLACLYQNNLKDNVKASEAVLRGLRDEYIDLVSRHTLCARAALLGRRKKDGLKDYLKDALATQQSLVETLQEAPSVTISEQSLESDKRGAKRVFVQDVEDGKMLSSVEEVVLEHFRQKGYTHGGHDEGATIKSLILACFWDEIYGETEAEGFGLFHSQFQTVPLDWNSETFYERRRERLKSKLQDLAEGGVNAVIRTYQEVHAQHFNTESIVNWKYLGHYEVVESLIRCLDIDIFLKLARLLLRHHRVYKSGFPDLTLWNPEEKKCIIVEVKSPNDQLSMKQRVWLHSLNKMGLQALVCHVQSVGYKGQKRKQEQSPETEDS